MSNAILVTKWFGTFIIKGNEIIAHKLFPKTSTQLAERLKKIANNEILVEEKELSAKTDEIYVTTERLLALGKLTAEELIRLAPEDYGYDYELLQKASTELAKNQLKEKVYEDLEIIQAVKASEEVIKVKNLFLARFREWFWYRFPISGFKEGLVKEFAAGKFKAKLDEEFDVLSSLATAIISLDKLESLLESYTTDKTLRIAPNLAKVATPLLAAKLIASSGGLDKLSALPASTIQLLGAEKALFKALRRRGKTPKYGLIFQHPTVFQAEVEQRGKVARTLANKIALAARIDYFSKEERSSA